MISNAVPAFAVFRDAEQTYNTPVMAWTTDGRPMVCDGRGIVPAHQLDEEFVAVATRNSWTALTDDEMRQVVADYEERLKESRRPEVESPVEIARQPGFKQRGPKP